MLEATREYAREKLRASGEAGRDRLAASYLADFFAAAEAAWPTTPTEMWLANSAPEVENLRAAIDWAFGESAKYHAMAGETGDTALGVRLVAHAGLIAEEMSMQADLKRWVLAATPHLTPDTPSAEAGWVRFWGNKSRAVFSVTDISPGRREAIALFRDAGDAVGLSCALRTAAMSIVGPGNVHPEAAPMLHEAIELLRTRKPSKDLATAMAHLGAFHYYNGDLATARRYNQDALTIRRALGDRTGCLASALNLAEFEFIGGNVEGAIRYAEEAVLEARRASHLPTLADLLANLAGYYLATDQVDAARRAAVEALALNRALDHHDHALPCVEHLALAHALSGVHQEAARLLGYTEGHFRRTGQVRDVSEQRAHDRLAGLLREALPSATLAALMAEGSAWPDAVADRIAQEVVPRERRGESAA
jgi:tetratricopeptide (TPR) repeat protein